MPERPSTKSVFRLSKKAKVCFTVFSICEKLQVIGSVIVFWITTFCGRNVVASVYGLFGYCGFGLPCFVMAVPGYDCIGAYIMGPDCMLYGMSNPAAPAGVAAAETTTRVGPSSVETVFIPLMTAAGKTPVIPLIVKRPE
jgi:hypothetical protein